jgi:UDP-2,3-diacylglucosamine hydrolase
VIRLFASDLHLADPDGRCMGAFEDLLTRSRADEVYLLGDLCEVWVGDDDDGPLARRFVAALRRAASRADVYVMPGNRDFLFGERFEAETGVRLIPDPHPLGGGVLLAHGDAFCIDDEAYQQARQLLRSPAWQADVLSRSLAERRALAEQMREQSRRTNANKAENIMDVAPAEVARVMAAFDADTLIHGHTHRPAVHREPWGRRYVLGAWEACGWYLEDAGGDFSLRCFPLPEA